MGEHWTTIFANIVTSIGILSLVGFYFSHRQSQVQFNFTVMISCIERYQKLAPLIREEGDKAIYLRQYVDLTNEEFFYFQRKYIPKEVIVEWVDTIVQYFPLYKVGNDFPVNYSTIPFKQIHDQSLLAGYPRLRKAFTLNAELDFSDRTKVIKAVARNLGIKLTNKHMKGALCLEWLSLRRRNAKSGI